MREKYVAAHPVRGVGLPPGASQKPVDEWFTAESLAATLEAQHASSAHYAKVTEWTSLTGLRWSETRAPRVSDLQDVPFPAAWVRRAQSEGYDEKAPKTENGERAVPLTDRARAIAREAAAGKRPEDYLFTSPKGRQLRMNLYRRFTRWSVTAPRKRPHMLRHYCASQWLRAGIPINQVAEWLGETRAPCSRSTRTSWASGRRSRGCAASTNWHRDPHRTLGPLLRTLTRAAMTEE